MSSIYLKSLNDSADVIKKTLNYTLVKEYDFIFSSHFVDQALARGFNTYEIYQMINKVCNDFRYKFSEETSLMIKYKDKAIICQVYHNVLGSFRRIVFKTIMKEKGKTYSGYVESTIVLDSL